MSSEHYGPRVLNNENSRRHAIQAIYLADDGMTVEVRKPKRSSKLNSLMWVVLAQLEPIDWYGYKLSKDEWKDMITAVLKRQKVVPGIEGGFVVVGEKTREKSAQEIRDIIDYACAFAASKGITIKMLEDIEPIGRIA